MQSRHCPGVRITGQTLHISETLARGVISERRASRDFSWVSVALARNLAKQPSIASYPTVVKRVSASNPGGMGRVWRLSFEPGDNRLGDTLPNAMGEHVDKSMRGGERALEVLCRPRLDNRRTDIIKYSLLNQPTPAKSQPRANRSGSSLSNRQSNPHGGGRMGGMTYAVPVRHHCGIFEEPSTHSYVAPTRVSAPSLGWQFFVCHATRARLEHKVIPIALDNVLAVGGLGVISSGSAKQ